DLSSAKNEIKIIHNIFIRSDIYEYIARHCVGELDKYVVKTRNINWETKREKLKELLEARFRHLLGLDEYEPIEQTWDKYFGECGQHPFEGIVSNIVLRPRDLLYFVSKLFESAFDKSHEKVLPPDFDYAKKHYLKFIKAVWVDELKYEYDHIYQIFQELDKYEKSKLSPYQLWKILGPFKYSKEKCNQLLSVLFNKGYLVGQSNKGVVIRDSSVVARKFSMLHNILMFLNINKSTIYTNCFYKVF
ncbi:MAG: hypothetical protein ABIA67_01640, partial [Candidatus Margulisiibacteriota bacterium]